MKVLFIGMIELSFLVITFFLERILMEHKEIICSLESQLTLTSICSIRIPFRNQDKLKKKDFLHELN